MNVCVIKMAFSQFEHVFGSICLGVGMVKYLECPISSPAPSPAFQTNFFLSSSCFGFPIGCLVQYLLFLAYLKP